MMGQSVFASNRNEWSALCIKRNGDFLRVQPCITVGFEHPRLVDEPCGMRASEPVKERGVSQHREGLGLESRDLVLVVPTWAIFFSLPGFSFSSAKERLACGSVIRVSKVQVGNRKVGLQEMPGL